MPSIGSYSPVQLLCLSFALRASRQLCSYCMDLEDVLQVGWDECT
jgi:hypothetical protein